MVAQIERGEGGMAKALKAFIVEDEAITAMYLKRYLSERGYDVLKPAATGEDAALRIPAEGPDLVLMDIRLGGPMDGVDTAKAILDQGDVNIVFMTGYESEDVRARTLEVRNIGFLSKPFTRISLDAVIPDADGETRV